MILKYCNKIVIISIITGVIILSSSVYYGLIRNHIKNNHVNLAVLNKELQDGDIIFQTSKSTQSKAIRLATGSEYTHMGMIFKKDNRIFVFEAVQPVKLTLLETWIKRGEKGHFVVKRLKKAEKLLTPAALKKMKQIGENFTGKDYDIYFEWSDKRMYCSELIWKIYKRAVNIEIGKPETLKDFNLSNQSVKQKLKERYGKSIPLDEIVISPASMYNSDKLTTVCTN